MLKRSTLIVDLSVFPSASVDSRLAYFVVIRYVQVKNARTDYLKMLYDCVVFLFFTLMSIRYTAKTNKQMSRRE